MTTQEPKSERSIAPPNAMARVVRDGLCTPTKHLPAWLFYDAEGSRLFELITELPEYYLTRAERGIFVDRADEIIGAALEGPIPFAGRTPRVLDVMELGAGTATKSQILLAATLERLGRCLFAPVDVSSAALKIAEDRLRTELPELVIRPIFGDHQKGCSELAKLSPRRFVLFIGSSMGNFADAENIALFASVRAALEPGDALLIGADRQKDVGDLIAAYDDAQGVTAAFNKNMLTRLNRELGAEFDLDAFRHVARWNADASRIEMHLESTCDQRVRIGGLDLSVRFARGETIHTESSVKYSDDRIRSILNRAGFSCERTFFDPEARFGVHLARAI
jgi:L-histidine N-alpha-methyltransferase